MDSKLRQKIVEFLQPLPCLESKESRKALLLHAGLDNILPDIDLSGSPKKFVTLLINRLENYGMFMNEQSALVCFLQGVKDSVGIDRRQTLQEFCECLTDDTRQLAANCPYRGLFAFREEDEQFFFGRETYIKKLLHAIQDKPLVAVIGASGSGKSSLVYAGLIPNLRNRPIPFRQKQGVNNWIIISFRPGHRPFHALSSILISLLESALSETDQLVEINKLTANLQIGQLTLNDVLERIHTKHPGSQLLLFADQFEELYTLCRNADDRRRFLDELLQTFEVSKTSKVSLVLTMRADFLNRALSYRPFADALQSSDIVLGPIDES